MSQRYQAVELAERLGDFPPTSEQQRVIEAPLEPMLVVAGAGSGKTATMADRVVYLVANGLVRPDQVLGVTFTRKAAGELRERISGKLRRLAEAGLISTESLLEDSDETLEVDHLDPTELLTPAVSTYHSYANTLVQEHGLRVGVERDATLIGEAQAWQIITELVAAYEHAQVLIDADQSPASLANMVMRLASDCAEHLCTPDDVEEFTTQELERYTRLCEGARKPTQVQSKLADVLAVRKETAELVRRYQRRKAEQGYMDYGDLLRYAAQIGREVPEAGAAERDRYGIVLLDEFQDTSYAQLELFGGLYGGEHGHPVTAVGDPNQSIYGFRGASAGQLFDFPLTFPTVNPVTGERNPAPMEQLTTAWRNGSSILEAANTLAAPLRRPQFSAPRHRPFIENLQSLSARPGAERGSLRLGWYATEEEENQAIVSALAQATSDFRSSRGRQPTRAVLTRTRSQLETVAAALRDRGVPCEIVGVSGLLSTPEVREVLAYLRVIADPERSDALVRILAGARYRLGPRDIYRLGLFSRQLQSYREAAASGEGPDSTRARGDGTSQSQHSGATDDAEYGDDRDGLIHEAAEMSSLVEAVDRLPTEAEKVQKIGLSEEGHRRLLHARDQLRRLRQWAGLDVATLIERVASDTGLDIELATRPWEDQHHARRQLNALIEHAESFSAASDRPDLMAFLNWLDAAEEKERGLLLLEVEPDPEAVQLLTVHASKGLEWDIVVVAGMRESRFPSAKADRWTGKNGQLPWPLRGDRASLPVWESDQEDLQMWACAEGAAKSKKYEGPVYSDDVKAFALEEERRLAYVAVTRARSVLIATGACFYGSARGGAPSIFLEEMRSQESSADAPDIMAWAEDLDIAQNPKAGQALIAPWPYDPLEGVRVRYETEGGSAQDLPLPRPSRRPAVERAAELVREQRQLLADQTSEGTTAWEEEAQWIIDRVRAEQLSVATPYLPTHLSASRYVSMARDPERAAERTRRPVPTKPSMAARRGTAMHAWLEEHFENQAAFELDIPDQAGDDVLESAFGLDEMKEKFLASRWAHRQIFAMEIPMETTLDNVTLRGRIDAVFGTDAAGQDVPAARREAWELLSPEERSDKMRECSWELVDWKTGAVPTGEDLQNKSLQLAVYRLAFSRLYALDLESVSASFHYIEHNRTLTFDELATEDELEGIIRQARRYFA